MKGMKKLRKVICTLLFYTFVIDVSSPVVLYALNSTEKDNFCQNDNSYVSLSEHNLKELIAHVVEYAVIEKKEQTLSDAILNCYRRILNGFETAKFSDVCNALPDILDHIVYENINHSIDDRSPGGCSISGCAQVNCNIRPIIHLIKRIQNQIGTVAQSSCCESILGILGDACQILGPDASISCSLKDLLFSLSIMVDLEGTLTQCCADLEEDFRHTWTQFEDLKPTITECCADLENNFRETWTILEDLQTTITDCCAILEDDFRQTWTILEAFEQLVEEKFRGTWTLLQDLERSFTAPCAQAEEDFRETWTILEAFEESVCDQFNQTWTILQNFENTITDCCANLEEDFRETWTIIDEFEEVVCDKFDQTFTIINGLSLTVTGCEDVIDKGFQETWTIIEGIKEETIIEFQETWTIIDGIEKLLCKKFDQTFSGIETIEMLLEVLTVTQSEGFFATCTLLQELSSEILDTMTLLEELSLTVSSDIQAVTATLCDKFEGTWTQLDVGFFDTNTTINELDTIICDKFEQTWTALGALEVDTQEFVSIWTALDALNERLCEKFEGTWTILESGFNDTQTTIDHITQELCEKFEQTWTILDTLNLTITGVNDFVNQTFTALQEVTDISCMKFEQTWTIIQDIKETVTECCEELKEDFRQTWTILEKINQGLGCDFVIRQDDLPVTISEPGVYCVTEPLSSSDAIMIDIQSDNVVLDLKNNQIMGTLSGSTGNTVIRVSDASKVAIQNGVITMAEQAILVEDGASNVLIDSIITFTTEIAMELNNAREIEISDCVINVTNRGIQGTNVQDAQILHCTVQDETGTGSGEGFDFSGSQNICYKECSALQMGIGFSSEQVATEYFGWCVAKGNSSDGFSFNTTNTLIVQNCQSIGNGGDGFTSFQANQSQFTSNSAIGNTGVGISNSGGNALYYNNVSLENTGGNFSGVDTNLVKQPSATTGFYTNVSGGDLDPECGCASEFAQTWTIIDGITTIGCEKFNQTFTIINNLVNNIDIAFEGMLDISSIFTTINTISQNFCEKFVTTWTQLEEIELKVENGPCPTVITQADMPLTINTPGKYCFSDSLTFNGLMGNGIEIEADNVTIDMQGFELRDTSGVGTGIAIGFVGTIENTKIINGKISGALTGIFDSAVNTCIDSVKIISTQTAIQADGGLNGTYRNLSINDTSYGIRFTNASQGYLIENFHISGSGNTAVPNADLIQILGGTNICIKNGCIYDANVNGININNGANTISINNVKLFSNTNAGIEVNDSTLISISNCDSSNDDIGFNIINSQNVDMRSCTAFGSGQQGFNIEDSLEVTACNCKSIGSGSAGFRVFDSSNFTSFNSHIINAGGGGMNLFGMATATSNCIINNSSVIGVTGSGFTTAAGVGGSEIQFNDSSAIFCSVNGFDLRSGSDCVIRNCSGTNNGFNGFEQSPGGSNVFYYNAANGNGTVAQYTNVTIAPVVAPTATDGGWVNAT